MTTTIDAAAIEETIIDDILLGALDLGELG